MILSRRVFLAAAPTAALVPSFGRRPRPSHAAPREATDVVAPAGFPSQDPDLVREFVVAAHGNVKRVRELLDGRPALAKSSWDWGFGDHETALGGASHVGSREIAEMLIGAGAPATIFSSTMLGHLDVVRAALAASPGLQRQRGPHGITLLAHARAGGPRAAEVLKYLEGLGDADPRYKTEPVDADARDAIAGTYAYGSADRDKLIVSITAQGGLAIRRDGATDRNLFHLGGRVFHPAGAEAVRIRFDEAGRITIEDGSLVIRATQIGR